MMRRYAIAVLLGGGLLALSGCDSADGTTTGALVEQLRMFAEDFARHAVAAYLI